MEDNCAVCADTLEWVAYGPCGHREVCSTCVTRLRIICENRFCCICKNECDVVFVTKALGDYTRMINDFSVLPSEVKEGRVGSYWYHEDTQAFFDDVEHYKMIRAMCKLSCSICDKMEEHSNDGSKRRVRFRSIEQLKGHLFHKHRSVMCNLCLEGRKVFICEQKLYTREQLKQHISTGDSEVDGTESERGGFSGHPLCNFCKTPFYGDNELYSHMSTEHYTCHICQRQHPGQYEHFKNYDDLEMHFRHSHFLCEDEACLAKKFIVFQSEAEMKRHNTVEHGGRMSRSKRNAALQIPTSFIYRQNSEQDHRRGRGRGRGGGGRGSGIGRGRMFRRDFSEEQLCLAIEASLETSITESNTFDDPSLSSSGQVAPDIGDPSDMESIVQPFESLGTADSEKSYRYLQALGQNSLIKPLAESAFPPLSTAPGSSQSKPNSDGLPNKTMASHLKQKSNRKVTVLNSGQAWPAANRGPQVPPNNSSQAWPIMNTTGNSVSFSQNKMPTANAPGPSTYASSAQTRSTAGNLGRISHSASAPNLLQNGTTEPSSSISDFPPISAAAQTRKLPTNTPTIQNSEKVNTANKSLVEKIRAALEFDEDKYTMFKEISGQYRQGLMDSEVYISYVGQFGLLHLVLDLARLCPDTHKQKELIDAYNASVRSNIKGGNDWASGGKGRMKDSNSSNKGKGKSSDNEDNSKSTIADDFINTVRKLQINDKPSEEHVEVLSRDGYRAAKGKSKLTNNDQQEEFSNNLSKKPEGLKNMVSTGTGKSGDAGNGSKQRKKTSKFHRVRLGDGSAAAVLNLNSSDPEPEEEASVGNDDDPPGGLPVRGVWRNGGQRLFS